MGSEVLLYAYGTVCLSMIGFNLIYSLLLCGSGARMVRRGARLEAVVAAQLRRLAAGLPLESGHLQWLVQKLARVRNLIAFDQMLDRFREDGSWDTVPQYLLQIRAVILRLAVTYRRRENLQAAYFAYFLRRHKIVKYMPMEMIQSILVDYMRKDSLYCRVNALKALCSFGSPEYILQAVEIQDQGDGFLHEKILTECLLAYPGDSDRLIRQFWEQMERFSIRTRLALLNYIRFRSGDWCAEMYRILDDPAQDRELRFAAMRYFGRYPYPPARARLLAFLNDQETPDWEYAAISAAILGSYPGEDVIQALIRAMHSGNWYIRYNAAASLEAHHLDDSDLLELVGGRDRYAREMILYRMESRRLTREAEREAVTAV